MISISAMLQRHHICPRKGFGQHFLVNTGVLTKIVRAVGPAPDESLLEIGPGIGVLTRMLADAGARVTAVEADRRMVEVLEAELGTHPRVRIVAGDILQVDLENLVQGPRSEVRGPGCKIDFAPRTSDSGPWVRQRVIGNIPYNISSPILFLLRDHRHLFREAVLMLQREVADRLTARVGTKEYGLLTLGLGVVGTCERLFDVAPGSFWPAPQVISSVVRIRLPDPPPFPDGDLAAFERVTRTAFRTRRKTIRNALLTLTPRSNSGFHSRTCGAEGGTRRALPASSEKGNRERDVFAGVHGTPFATSRGGATPAPVIDEALAMAGIDPTRRPETLSVQEYVDLARRL